ncbi:Sua5/YciO/YrdC/YwlC family protein, partial [Bacillus pumilus]|uniref:Sua5/YciO/YrdC/YwlC family protein n=1 Tax=Bacillus pumilus TaxID=1408 RepID=UPI0021B39792
MLLEENEVVGFGRERVYGVGGNGKEREGVMKIYEVKGRGSDNGLIVEIVEVEQVHEFGEIESEKA